MVPKTKRETPRDAYHALATPRKLRDWLMKLTIGRIGPGVSGVFAVEP